jgi:16S rRNA (guanine(966)-N(2))-methyltransferase RsmD
MRVIAGKLRGAKLFGPEEYEGTRPISDRAKEAMFSILQERTTGARFLDLFAGTGGVGIEALSRHAAHATFVELHATPICLIRKNLLKTRFTDQAPVVRADVFSFIAETKEVYDIIFVAPPQWQGLWHTSLEAIDHHTSIVSEKGVMILQCDPTEYHALPLRQIAEFDQRKYGGVLLTFFRVGGGCVSR